MTIHGTRLANLLLSSLLLLTAGSAAPATNPYQNVQPFNSQVDTVSPHPKRRTKSHFNQKPNPDLRTAGSVAVSTNPYQTFQPFNSQVDDFLYPTARQGNFSYNVTLPNGAYFVTLFFAELEATGEILIAVITFLCEYWPSVYSTCFLCQAFLDLSSWQQHFLVKLSRGLWFVLAPCLRVLPIRRQIRASHIVRQLTGEH
jgi:hypothetical protein